MDMTVLQYPDVLLHMEITKNISPINTASFRFWLEFYLCMVLSDAVCCHIVTQQPF